MKIFVIDPDRTMREVLIKTLGQIEVFSPFESDGIAPETISLISQEKPEFVFVDFDCFSDDAAEIISNLKKNSPASKIILISGVGADEDIIRTAIESGGADSSIIKPFRLEDIKRVIKKESGGGDASKPNVKITRPAERNSPESQIKSKQKISPAILLSAIILLAVGYAVFFKSGLLKPSPQPSASFATGLKNISYISATSDGRLVLTDWQEEAVYFYKIPQSPLEKSLLPLATLKNKDIQPASASLLSSDGKADELIITDALQGMIFVVRMDYSIKGVSPTVPVKGIILKNFKSPDASPAGILAISSKKPPEVWTYDNISKKLYRYKIEGENFSVKNSYELPVENPAGITFMNGRFYLGESGTGRIIELNLTEEGMSISSIIRPAVYSPSAVGNQERLVGIASDGKNLWSISESGVVYRHHPSEFETNIK